MSHQGMEYCSVCKENTLHVGPSTSHVLHLLLSIITMGFWLIVWLIVAQNNKTKTQCTVCGRMTGAFGFGSGGVAPGPTPETHSRCPDCKELVLKEARVCKHCGCKLVPQT